MRIQRGGGRDSGAALKNLGFQRTVDSKLDPEFERNRKQKEYDASIEDDKKGKPRKLHEITPGHYVRCSEDEIAMYQAKAASYEK